MKALAYAPCSKLLVSGGLDKLLILWDLTTGTKSGSFPRGPDINTEHLGSIYSLAINTASTCIVTGCADRVIKLFDPRTNKRLGCLMGHADMVKTLVLNADGTRCISGSSDHTVKLWDIGEHR